ncbi:conserved hypothetical protein [Lodderomyces elongisporus NRRL YB-4239]|uniref:Methyltransferase domain-containing protein n=1 Tax=Lodderomyces elongisporus (strain ATCC 11503 / CBS 2605 / JCM 1781 / NBRC 1676 / NRRL YB-4239) TaxID=379508 RepID=A5E198_LODEL|nr:conserved hypothetical protein [Lodderomyces elongisporus NRRL YB-4239]
MTEEQAYYKKGFHKSVADTHAGRTVENSSKFTLSVLKPDFKVLDVGSGPGTITVDFAQRYLTKNGGSIIGIEPTQELIDQADAYKKEAAPELKNIKFQLGSVYKIPFDNDTFDLVHAHQVVVHLQDPILALQEMKRVTKPGGFVCVKDGDLESSIITPEKYEPLKQSRLLKAKNSNSTDIRGGRKLRERAIRAGYEPENIVSSLSYWLIGDTRASKQNWASLLKSREQHGGEVMYPNDKERDNLAREQNIELLDEWGKDVAALYAVTNFEIIYKKPFP